MGRPLNKRWFGTGAGKIGIYTDAGGDDALGVVRQKGTREYILTGGSDRFLVSGNPATTSEGRLFGAKQGGGSVAIKTLQAHKLQGYDGNVYLWSTTAADNTTTPETVLLTLETQN